MFPTSWISRRNWISEGDKAVKRAEINAFCGSRETLYQRIAFFAAPTILLAGVVYVAVRYASLPAEIPTHYNAFGEIDGWGSRGTLWIMPVIGILCDALMLAVSFFPQTWNVGTSVTVFNRALVYRRVRDLIADMRLSMAVMFTAFAVWQTTLSPHFPWWMGVLMGVCCTAPLVRFFVRLAMKK